MPCPPPPGRPPPLHSPGAACGTRWPWKSSPASDTRCRGCCRPTQPLSASTSARRLPPPWPRAPALPRPASRQHRQAAVVSPTRASGQPLASLPCGCQRQREQCRTGPCARPSTLWSGSNRGKRCGRRSKVRHLRVCLCLCVCTRTRERMCIRVRHRHSLTHSATFCLCVCLTS